MPQLVDDYPELVRAHFGDRLADAIAVQAPQERAYLMSVAQTLTVTGKRLALAVSPTEPVIDFGGRNRNETMVGVPIDNISGTELGKMVEEVAGFAREYKFASADQALRGARC